MRVEIWSDIMCPFCYIGKRKFEAALSEFEHSEDIQVVWKSFQLNPAMKTEPDKNIHQYLAEHKGVSLQEASQMNEHVTAMAREVGLEYNFDKAVVANSFDAHRLIQLAKKHGKGDEAEERLFRAYFTEGANIADRITLTKVGEEIGLAAIDIENMFKEGTFAREVKDDIREAQQIGVRGVPFFVLDRKYGVSGAQPSEVFLSALTQAYEEAKPPQITPVNTASGDACDVDGNCE
uniref:DsbA family oxidoreductase n=1 Tax=Roseihalotalea indica TaxID=2867963 RepID=A0AA49GTM5_9BACT|nr:DsbA family oxidoreductase [Tunicatimonas sp. TK19036]